MSATEKHRGAHRRRLRGGALAYTRAARHRSLLRRAVFARCRRPRGGVASAPRGVGDPLPPTLRVIAMWEGARWVLRSRERRVAVQSAFGVGTAAALSLAAPAVLLVYSPLLLGVPHVVGGLRHLMLRRSVSGAFRGCTLAACGLLTALRLRAMLQPSVRWPPWLEFLVAGAWVASGAVLGAVEYGQRSRALWTLSALLPLGAMACANPYVATLVLVHAHNVITIGVWLLLFRSTLRASWLPITAVGVAAALVSSDRAIAWSLRYGFTRAAGIDLVEAMDWVVPGLDGALALRLTYLFILLQFVHYAVWLAWAPSDDSPGNGRRSFRESARGLVSDLGRVGLSLACLGCVAVAFAGVALTAPRAREIYLALAGFHVYLELAAFAYLSARGHRVPKGC